MEEKQTKSLEEYKNNKIVLYVFIAMAVISWLVPDPLPFIDEILLPIASIIWNQKKVAPLRPKG